MAYFEYFYGIFKSNSTVRRGMFLIEFLMKI